MEGVVELFCPPNGSGDDVNHQSAAVKTWIINLERSTDRRVHMERQLADHLSGLEHEFVVAVDGRSLDAAERAGLVDQDRAARFPPWLTPGFIGCTLSHRAVRERISTGEHPIGLVLEDDVVLSPDVERVVMETADQMAGAEVVLVEFRTFKPCRFTRTGAARLSDGRYLAHPVEARQLTSGGAYLITREAAERLASMVLPASTAPDAWKFLLDAGGFDRLRCVVPSPIRMNPGLRSTSVGLVARRQRQRDAQTPGDTLLAWALDAVAYRLPPFQRAMCAWRAHRYRQWSQYVFVDDA